jgi:hypothetical protein
MGNAVFVQETNALVARISRSALDLGKERLTNLKEGFCEVDDFRQCGSHD